MLTIDMVSVPRTEYERLKAAAAASEWARQAHEAAVAWAQIGSRLKAQDPILWGLLQSAEVRACLMEAYVQEIDRRQLVESSNAIAAMRDWTVVYPSHAELRCRRAQPGEIAQEARNRRGGDYAGGPVDWATGVPLSAARGVAA
ncbi:hypothetical protein [Saccharopolyspora shandongensis]|uniref:hypothetical protein n=1 Tax=Saccharopolyspora shandongensis TaxID=418495 RepID=UPI0033CF789B